MSELIKVLIGVMCFATFFGIFTQRGRRLRCFVAWLFFLTLGSWLFGGLGGSNPPAAHQTRVSDDRPLTFP
jgi:hypothetical protein